MELGENADVNLLELGDNRFSIDQILVDLLSTVEDVAQFRISWHFGAIFFVRPNTRKIESLSKPKICLFGVYKKDAKDFKNFFYSS